ncbi:MAG: DsbA family protein [Methylocystaceae bacterium]|nr:DsbA family protein [Methylocystaceae bacterium]
MRILILALSFFLLTQPLLADDNLSTGQQDEVRELVRDTLLKNPEILMESMQILQERQEQAKAEMQQKALTALKDKMIIPGITPIGGNPEGDVTMIEFFDYQCGYCKRAFPGVMEVVNNDKNIKYVLKEFAILGPMSEVAARAALAAQMQGKYMDFHTAMMTVRGRLSEEKIYKTAQDLGLDLDRLKTDMKSDTVNQEITSTRQLANLLNITGTPAFIIGDQIMPGAMPPEALIEAVKNQREKN